MKSPKNMMINDAGRPEAAPATRMRRLTAKAVPHSSIVGGGFMLLDEKGAAAFNVAFMGTTAGIRKAETEALSRQICDLINKDGITVPVRDDE